MEPAVEQRDDGDVRQMAGVSHKAAMEPAVEQRDDAAQPGRPAAGGSAAMEPAVEQRDDFDWEVSEGGGGKLPQWSPPSSSGMTRPEAPLAGVAH